MKQISTPSQAIIIPQQLTKHNDFLIHISQYNDKVYSHIQYLKYLVQSMYDLYQKMSKALIKLSEEYQKKMSKMNDSTAMSILNFIKGISKLFQNIREQICNNTVNLSKKNQKVSRTRKDIVNQKLAKINQLYAVYLQKVHKYNQKQQQYQQKCVHFMNIEQDVFRFYSTKDNKALFEELQKKQVTLQEQLEETYSLKMQLKSGLNEIRLSLKEIYEMLSDNAEDDKKLLMSVRKKLKEAKIFNETIIQEVNSQAEESIKPQEDRLSNFQRHSNMNNNASLTNNQLTQRQSISPTTQQQQNQWSFPQLSDNTTIHSDIKDITKNIMLEEYSIETFCQFVTAFEKQIITHGQGIDKMRSTEDFQKFIDKKFQINQLLTSDMVNNTQAIKNEIADIRQILQGIKGLLNKKKVISELKKYRAMKFEKFIIQTQIFVELQKKQNHHTTDIRRKYKEQKQKFARGHLELMRRFRQIVQDIFRGISEEFKFQRNPDLEFRKVKNEFIKKKYYSLLMLSFFINKQDTPKFQINTYLKNYEKYMTEQNMMKVGLAYNTIDSIQRNNSKSMKKGWGCCGISLSPHKSGRNKYIDEYNCALRNGIVLIQGKMKIHQNYLKFISSFNAKTIFGQTNIRLPKGDIASIQRKYVLLSLVLVINTIHGQLSFTSFLSDPYETLMQIYENKQPTKKIIIKNHIQTQDKPQDTKYEEKVTEKTSNETFTVTNYCKSPRNSTGNFIIELQEKFQSQIPQLIDKNAVNFESLSTYLSESKKQLSISVQYNLVENKDRRYFFEIKIIEKNSKIEYKFVHEKSMQNEQIKKMLEKMAADIVNNNFNASSSPKRLLPTEKQISNPDENKQKKLSLSSASRKQSMLMSSGVKNQSDKIFQGSEYSFIERKQNNQFEFDRDPSFVYVKQPSIRQHHGGDPSFNYVPDLQIFKNMESEKKITFGPLLGSNMSKSNHSDKPNQSRKGKNEHSLTQKDINEYLNSIDEKDIQKSLKGNSKGRTERKYSDQSLGKNLGMGEVEQKQQEKGGFTVNHLILLLLIVVVGLNFFVSIFK